MSAALIARSSLLTSLTRYSRSWGIWILLLIAPVGARLFIPRGDGTTIVISVADQLPVMTSSVIGVCLGVVVSTLMLPAAYIYLRANTNRRQPWQVEEVSPAARVPIALGRFGADVAVLLASLAALTLAGAFLGWLILPAGTLNVLELSFALWAIAAPALMGLAAIRILFDALPLLRGALGDFAYFCIWMATLAVPAIETTGQVGFAANMSDPVGFVRPLIHGSGLVDPGFAIGGAEVKPGRIPIDAMAGLTSPGYLPSRGTWAGLAVLVAMLAGLLYRPHRVRARAGWTARLTRRRQPGAPPAANPQALAAAPASTPALGLLIAEARLIGSGRLMRVLAAGIALAGIVIDWPKAALPLALLWLVFALSMQAGRAETRGLASLTGTAPFAAWMRRLAFVAAGTGWSVALALPHAIVALEPSALGLAALLGAVAAGTAALLAWLSGSGFAPRIVLLIAWYVYTAG
jgi:hypothetical protein